MSTSNGLSNKDSSTDLEEHFMYFAYGSNLLTKRIHINNPSAVFIDAAKLEGYKLDFNYYSKRWRGAAATIVEAENKDHLWGALWKLHIDDRPHLDRQEGVKICPKTGRHIGVYRPLKVSVLRGSSGEPVTARTYQLITPPEQDRRPSKVYLDVIKQGAKEHNLPLEYQQFLSEIEHNSFDDETDVTLNLQEK